MDLHLFPLSRALLSCAFSPILPISINSLEKSLFKSLGVILESQEILCPPIQKLKYYRHRIGKIQGLYVFLDFYILCCHIGLKAPTGVKSKKLEFYLL